MLGSNLPMSFVFICLALLFQQISFIVLVSARGSSGQDSFSGHSFSSDGSVSWRSVSGGASNARGSRVSYSSKSWEIIDTDEGLFFCGDFVNILLILCVLSVTFW